MSRYAGLLGNAFSLTSVAAAATTATAAAIVTVPTVAASTTIPSHLRQTRIDLLLGLMKNRQKITGLLGICGQPLVDSARKPAEGERGAWSVLTVRSEECDRGSVRAGTASTTNSVDVVLRVVGIVIVEHVSDVAHVFLDRLAVFRERVCIATVQPDPDSESIGTSKLPMVPLRTLLLW